MNLPQKWSEIPLETYLELRGISGDNFNGMTSYMVEVISILSGEDVEDIFDRGLSKVKELYERVSFVNSPPVTKVKKTLEVGGLKLTYKGMRITFGELIDLSKWNEGEGQPHKMAATLYRQTRVGEWGQLEFEPRVYNTEERAAHFLSLSTYEVWGVVEEFRRFNNQIREKYEDLFKEDPEEEDPSEYIEGAEKEVLTIQSVRAAALEKAKKHHQWQSLVFELAGKDITKINEVLKTDAIVVLNMLAMIHDTKQA